MRVKGKFWPAVRAFIWEKAQQLYQEDQEAALGNDYKGITATKVELREAGYFNQAKSLVLRHLRWRKKVLLLTDKESVANPSLES